MLNNLTTTLAASGATLIVFLAAVALYKRKKTLLFLPLLVTTAISVLFLLLSGITYQHYQEAVSWISSFLGPAVVALAIPLYRQLPLIKKYFRPLIISITTGALFGVASGFMLGALVGLKMAFLQPLLTKSVTAPVAMDIMALLNGNITLAAILVTIAGLTGAIVSGTLFKWTHISHFIGKGVAFGAGAHAIGTAKALEHSEAEGAISSISMIVCAIIVSIAVPVGETILLTIGW
ncbi:LrgB family protein [Shouchella clausii]|uniref:LrgB family protein n=1 Tax=Shouchella clausii TaxID=79880 RepID=UPI00280B3A63|nr:LrgB family protein [Shouchella clausii]WMM31127.1 LrgB family protein [Shouchella clausii]